MKKLFPIIFVVGLLSCSRSSRTVQEPFPNLLAPDLEWITYEGTLPSGNGQDLLVEIHLLPGAPGMHSYYKLTEKLDSSEADRPFVMSTKSQGTYSVLSGSPGHNIVQITNRRRMNAVMLGKKFGHGEHVTGDLLLKSNGDHELVMVNEDFQLVDPRFLLIRRSGLFTVEGYLTVVGDSAEYFERNTQKPWAVARFACYDKAVSSYHVLAKEKFEGVYLKALSYSVRQKDRNGREIDMLVFKRILRMGDTEGI